MWSVAEIIVEKGEIAQAEQFPFTTMISTQ